MSPAPEKLTHETVSIPIQRQSELFRSGVGLKMTTLSIQNDTHLDKDKYG